MMSIVANEFDDEEEENEQESWDPSDDLSRLRLLYRLNKDRQENPEYWMQQS